MGITIEKLHDISFDGLHAIDVVRRCKGVVRVDAAAGNKNSRH
jgi:hypothetical protein